MIYEKLKDPLTIRAELRKVDRDIEALRLSMLPGAIRYDKDRVQSSASDQMLVYAEKIDALLIRRRELECRYESACMIVLEMLCDLPERHRRAMWLKYLGFKSNRESAAILGISRRHLLRIRDEAYDMMKNVLHVTP